MSRNEPPTPGLGLQATRRRLQLFYGDDQQITTSNLSAGGAEVRIQIPFLLNEFQLQQNEALEAEIFGFE